MMSGVMVILDGMQDTAYGELGNRSPYDAGRGDSLRRLEVESSTGTLRTTPDGFVPDTLACVATLLGVPAERVPQGRSYLEALVQGIDVGPGDIIMRCNFVKLNGEGRLEVPCCEAPPETGQALLREIADCPGYGIWPVGPYKSLQLVAGRGQDLEGLVTFAPHQHQGGVFRELLPQGSKLGEELAQFSLNMLEKYHPYTVLHWAPAVPGTLPSFGELHGGRTGAMVSKTDAPLGAAIAMGMTCPDLPTCTGDTDTDLGAKLAATLELIKNGCDMVMVHVGGPDEATHRQNPREKADFIHRCEEELIAPLMETLPQGTRVLLTCDHVALCTTAGHTDEPVRFWLWEKGKPLSGEWGELGGTEAVPLLLGDRDGKMR